MTVLTPILMQPTGADADITYSGSAWRDTLGGLFITGNSSLGDVTSLQVVQRGAGANMSVDVSAGWCSVQGTDAAGQGIYLCRNTSTFNLPGVVGGTAFSAPGSGTRTHRVVARIKDKSANGAWTTYQWTPDAVLDSGSGLPALPPSCYELARVSIAAGQVSITNANITDMRLWMGLAGGVAAVASSGGGPVNPYTGQMRSRVDTGIVERWSGTAWLNMENRAYALIRKSSAASIGAGGWTMIGWESAQELTVASMWNIASPTRMIAPEAGVYAVSGNMSWNASTATTTLTSVIKNGSGTNRWRGIDLNTTAAGGEQTPWYFEERCVAGDYFEAGAFPFTNSANLFNQDNRGTWMSLRWIRP